MSDDERLWWQPAKAELNRRKHGITFYEARSVMRYDPLLAAYPDEEHSDGEDRWIAVGREPSGPVLFIIYAIRDDRPWIISARRATAAEIRRYMTGDRIRDRDTTPTVNVDSSEYASIAAHCVAAVSLDDDVAQVFYLEADVDAALRTLIAEGRAADPIGIDIPIPSAAIDLDDDIAPEYDLTGRVPARIGPIFGPQPVRACVTVRLDLCRHFPTDRSINDALRELIAEGRVPQRRRE